MPEDWRTSEGDERAQTSSSRPTQIAAGSIVIGLLVVFASPALALANADSMVPVLISTQDLTLFYWGQDRLGSVVPLLASFVRAPWWNFAVQSTILGSAFFLLILGFVRHHLFHTDRARSTVLVAVPSFISGLAVLWILTDFATYKFVFEQVYALSMGLAFAGLSLMVSFRGRTSLPISVAGAVCIFVATLINPSVLLLAPAVWLLQPPGSSWTDRSVWSAIVAMLGSFGVVSVLSKMRAQTAQLPYNKFSVTDMFDNVGTALQNVRADAAPGPALLCIVVAVVTLVAAWRRMSPRLRLAYLFAPLFGVAWTFVFSGNAWVELNLLSARYFFPLYASVMLLIAGASTELVARVLAIGSVPTWSRTRAHGRFGLSMAVVVAVGAFIASVVVLHRVTPSVVESSEPLADAAERYDAPLIVGDYWAVWPAVVESRSRELDVLGVTLRADPTVSDIAAISNDRAAHDDSLVVVCATAEPTDCAVDVSAVAGRIWTVDSVISEQPLVVQLGTD